MLSHTQIMKLKEDEEYYEKEIKKLKEQKDIWKKEIKKNDISFIEKISNRIGIKDNEKRIAYINQGLKLYYEYCTLDCIKDISLSSNQKKSVEYVLEELDEIHRNIIEKLINESIIDSRRKGVKKDRDTFKKLYDFYMNEKYRYFKHSKIFEYMKIINKERIEKTQIYKEEKFNVKKTETQEKSSEEKTLDLLQEMTNKGMLKGNKQVAYALKNYKNIIKASGEKERLKKLNSSIETLKSELSDESKLSDVNNIDFSNVVKELDKIEKENKKKIEKYEKTLKNIDFNYLRGLTKEYEEEKERNKEKENKKATFRSLVKSRIYKIEYGEDTSEIDMQIERFSLDPDIKKDIIREAEMEHHKKLQEEKAAIDGRREKEEHEQELWREVKNNIRRQAIENIKKRNPFGGPFEVRNGDVYSQQSFESMVDEEVERMFEESSLSPEERGLRDMKRRGTMPSSATVGDLSYQQKMDFKNFYGDNSFGYIKEVKKVKRTVYEDYLRYRAGKPKEEVMRFFEFSQKYYDGLFNEKEAEEIESGARKL